MSKVDLASMIQDLKFSTALEVLYEAGLTSEEIRLIQCSQCSLPYTSGNNKFYSLMVLVHEAEPGGRWAREVVKLRSQGLVKINAQCHHAVDYLELTKSGVRLKEALKNCPLTDKPREPAEKREAVVLVPEVRGQENKEDLDLGRDGLLETMGKLWYIWTHGSEIRDAKLARQVQEMIQGEDVIVQAMRDITTSEQRVGQQLARDTTVPVAKEYWTLEDQRRTNDLYWNTEGAAFWLNANMYMGSDIQWDAVPLPAPDWWKATEAKTSVVHNAAQDLLTQSLQDPRVEPTQVTVTRSRYVSGSPIDITGSTIKQGSILVQNAMNETQIQSQEQTTTMRAAERARARAEEAEMRELLEVKKIESAQFLLGLKYLLFGYSKVPNIYFAFKTDAEAERWYRDNPNSAKTLARRGSLTYQELLAKFEIQERKSELQDQEFEEDLGEIKK